MKRRRLLKVGANLAGIAGLAYFNRNGLARAALTRISNGTTATLAPKAGADICVMTPAQTAGPYNLQNDSVLRELDAQTGVILEVDRTENQTAATVRFGIA